MKYLFVLFCLLIITHFADAQREMWGMTTYGGIDNQGVLFKTDKTGKKETVMHYFDTATGAYPEGSLIQATNGNLYGFTGLTSSGVANRFFEFNPITKNYKVLLNYDTILGANFLIGSPFYANNGKIYFLAATKLMELNPANGIIRSVANLPPNVYATGNYLMQASDGNLYFATQATITVGTRGALFRFNPNTYALTKLLTFTERLGSPFGSFIEWSPGLLYGTFSTGTDSLQYGGIFTYNIATNYYGWQALFGKIGAEGPYGGLTRVGNKLYGCLFAGAGFQSNGLIYKYEPATDQHLAERLNDVARRAGSLVSLEQDDPRGRDVERQAQQRRHQQNRRKQGKFQRAQRIHRHQHNHQRERDIEREEHIQQRWRNRQRHHPEQRQQHQRHAEIRLHQDAHPVAHHGRAERYCHAAANPLTPKGRNNKRCKTCARSAPQPTRKSSGIGRSSGHTGDAPVPLR